jgi:hypothetical protein
MIWGDNIQKKGVILGNQILVYGFRGEMGTKKISIILSMNFEIFEENFYDFWTMGAIKIKLKRKIHKKKVSDWSRDSYGCNLERRAYMGVNWEIEEGESDC